jgi:hypothetical protein
MQGQESIADDATVDAARPAAYDDGDVEKAELQ